jgi:hypothetical protein
MKESRCRYRLAETWSASRARSILRPWREMAATKADAAARIFGDPAPQRSQDATACASVAIPSDGAQPSSTNGAVLSHTSPERRHSCLTASLAGGPETPAVAQCAGACGKRPTRRTGPPAMVSRARPPLTPTQDQTPDWAGSQVRRKVHGCTVDGEPACRLWRYMNGRTAQADTPRRTVHTVMSANRHVASRPDGSLTPR